MTRSEEHVIQSVHAVGRYALGVKWGDGHDSIFPFTHLRRRCPCDDCDKTQAAKRPPSESEGKLAGLDRLGDASVMLRWGDGHETLFLLEELRDACGCAACKGEPDYPITGQ